MRLRDGVAEEDQPIVGEGTEVRRTALESNRLDWIWIPKHFSDSIYPFGKWPRIQPLSLDRVRTSCSRSFVPNSRDYESGGGQQQVLNEALIPSLPFSFCLTYFSLGVADLLDLIVS